MSAVFIRAALAALLVLGFGTTTRTAQAEVISSAVSSPVTDEALGLEIDRQADLVFEALRGQNPQLPINGMRQVQREAVYRFKQLHVLSDVLKAAGPAPAVTLVATEIFSTFILGPILIAAGHPGPAGIAAAIPWGVFAAAGVASYNSMKLRWKIARELGISSLGPLDHIRRAVVGYDMRHRVSTAVFQLARERIASSVEFEVLRRRVSTDASQAPFITVRELESIIRNGTGGAEFLVQIAPQRIDQHLYVALLLRQIDAMSGASTQLLSLLKARSPMTSTPVGLRHHLVAIAELRQQIARDIRELQHEISQIRGPLLRQARTAIAQRTLRVLSADQEARIRLLNASIAGLQFARELSVRHEYTLLNAVRADYVSGNIAEVDRVSHRLESGLIFVNEALVRSRQAVSHAPASAVPSSTTSVRNSTVRSGTSPVLRRIPMCRDLFAGARAI